MLIWYWVHFDFPETYLSCMVFATDPVSEMGKTVQTSYPWSLGHVSEVLCHCGSRSQEPQDIIAKMCHIFHVGLKKPSQYYVHLLFWNLFIEDNFLVILFCFFFPRGPSPFPDKTSTVKGLKKKKLFYSRFLMQMSNLELTWKRMFKWTSLPHHPFLLNFSKPSIQVSVLVFWWRKNWCENLYLPGNSF